MSKNITPEKLSELVRSLSGKECAFLALEYFNKEDQGDKKYRHEVEIIHNSINPYSSDIKRQEFMFYYNIGSNLDYFCLDLQTNMLVLKNLDKQLDRIRGLLTNSIMVSSILKGFRFIPKIVTEDEFEVLYQKVRGEFLSEVLSLQSVAQHEAFLSLKKEGYLTESDNFDSCRMYFEERRGKSKDQLVDERVQQIYKYLQESEERQLRGVDTGEGIYKDYKGLSLEDIGDKIREKENFNIPTPEECQRWDEAIAQELRKLQQGIENGILKIGTVKDKGGWYHSGDKYIGAEGIISESWYNYSDKLGKDLNEFIDNKVDAVEFYEGEFVIAKGGFASYKGEGNSNCSAERSRLRVEENLKMFLLLNEEDGLVDISNPELKEAFVYWVEETQYRMQKLVNHIEVIKRVEEEILEGVVRMSDDLLERASSTISEVITIQEDSLSSILKYFRASAYFKPVDLKDLDKYKLIADIAPEEEWVNKTINYLVNITNKQSNYSYKYKV